MMRMSRLLLASLATILFVTSCGTSKTASAVSGEPVVLSKVYEFKTTPLKDGIIQVELGLCTEGVSPSMNEKGEWAFAGSGHVANVVLFSKSERIDEGTYTPAKVELDEALVPSGYADGNFAAGMEIKLFGLFPIPVYSRWSVVKNGKADLAQYLTEGKVTVKRQGDGLSLALDCDKVKASFDGKMLAETVKQHYYEFTKKEQPLEKKYAVPGPEEVAYAEVPSDIKKTGKVEIWYPKSLESGNLKFPVVIYANGTGQRASMDSYPDFLSHLASWGFIVIGNEDENTRTGASCQECLDRIMALNADKNSVFHGKVDMENIGISGHSQGGAAAYNAVAAQPGGNRYKAIFAISATSPFWGQANQLGTDWSYDLSNVQIPTFMAAGTGYFDAGTAKDINAKEGQGITPLYSLEMNYKALPSTTKKMYARKTGIDHGDTFKEFDAYMTAWFMWLLKGDAQAAGAFVGENAELAHNSLYQDVKSNL